MGDWSMLKSDQNGIESVGAMQSAWSRFRLKSDQNGIESFNTISGLWDYIMVKIRPKWD